MRTDVNHCGIDILSYRQKTLNPSSSEKERGVKKLIVREYWCHCRKRLLYYQEQQDKPFIRARSDKRTAILKRLRGHIEVDWVLGMHSEYLTMIKVPVK